MNEGVEYANHIPGFVIPRDYSVPSGVIVHSAECLGTTIDCAKATLLLFAEPVRPGYSTRGNRLDFGPNDLSSARGPDCRGHLDFEINEFYKARAGIDGVVMTDGMCNGCLLHPPNRFRPPG